MPPEPAPTPPIDEVPPKHTPAPALDITLRQIGAKLDQLLELQQAGTSGAIAPMQVDIGGASKLTGFSRRMIDKMLSSGRFPRPHKPAGKRMWFVESLRAWVEAGCPPASAWAARQAAKDRNRKLDAVAASAEARR